MQVIPYADQGTTSLVSAPIAHPGGWVVLEFDAVRDTEPGFDFLNIEFSVDGGAWASAPWVFDSGANAWSDELTFDGKNAAHPNFSRSRVAFDAVAGTLRVRFRFASDLLLSAPLYTGVAVDQVVIKR
jgi:hypothetical protein